MKSIIAYITLMLCWTTMSVVLVLVSFLLLSTQIPVGNNALWVGMCIIVAGLNVAGAAAFASTSKKRDAS